MIQITLRTKQSFVLIKIMIQILEFFKQKFYHWDRGNDCKNFKESAALVEVCAVKILQI